MEKIGTSLRTFTKRLSRKSSYEIEETSPHFKLKALSNGKGMRIFGVEPLHARQAVHQMVDLCGDGQGVDTSLVLAGRRGVILLNKNDEVLLRYEIQEIVICFADKLYEDVFVFMGDKDREIRCHAFRCGTLERAQLICLAMAKMFQVHYNACSDNGSSSDPDREWSLYVENLGLSTSQKHGQISCKTKVFSTGRRRSLADKPTFAAQAIPLSKRRFSEQTHLTRDTDMASSTYIFEEDDIDELISGSPDSVEGIGEWDVDSDGECLITN